MLATKREISYMRPDPIVLAERVNGEASAVSACRALAALRLRIQTQFEKPEDHDLFWTVIQNPQNIDPTGARLFVSGCPILLCGPAKMRAQVHRRGDDAVMLSPIDKDD